jgi:membrane-bound lytic murein transglycosylase B
VLTRADRLRLQQELDQHGFDVGEPDGRLGARTREAVRAFQARIGRVPDGFATAGLLKQLMAK